MKNKTSKQRKLEKGRYSILTNNLDYCFFCGNPKHDMHEIYPGRNKQASMRNGFCIPICRMCHSKIQINYEVIDDMKKLCQSVYEQTHTREEFMEIIRRNYL